MKTGSDRVFRGGSWFNDARLCRSAFRNYDEPSRRCYHLGVRLIRRNDDDYKTK